MIWIDFGIMCIGQEKISMPSNIKEILIEGCKRTIGSEALYNESYNFCAADRLLGCWYKIWLPESICYEESFFDISSRNIPWIEVVPKWEKVVQNILTFYINESPVHEIAVLLRVQDDSDDIVHSDCKFDDFMQKLKDGSIRWNELYYV